MSRSRVYKFFYPPGRARWGGEADFAGFDRLIAEHGGLVACLHFWSTLLLLLSPLERLAAGWFWGYWITGAIGESFPYDSWLRWHRRVVFVIAWPLSTAVIGVLFWGPLGKVDLFTHALRTWAGHELGLHRLVGEDYTHAALCVVFFGGIGLFGLVYDVLYTLYGTKGYYRPQVY